MNEPDQSGPGSRESAYMVVMLVMVGLCVGLFSWGRLQGIALEKEKAKAKAKAVSHMDEVIRLREQISSMRARAQARRKASMPRPLHSPRTTHVPYRSVVSAIPPGLLLGGPLRPPGRALPAKKAVPRPKLRGKARGQRAPTGFFGGKSSITLLVVKEGFRYTGKVRKIPLSLWLSAKKWSPAFRGRVRAITLKDISIKPGGLRLLSLFPNLKKLRLLRLSLGGTPLSSNYFPVGLAALEIAQISGRMQGLCDKKLPVLLSLRLNYLYSFRDRAMRCVGGMPALRRLALTNLTHLTDRGLALLRASNQLRLVTLNGCKSLNGIGLVGLVPHKELAVLRMHNLPKLEDQSLRHLAGHTRLRLLSLKRTRITGVGLRHLGGLKRLEQLILDDSRFSNKGAAAIPVWPRLQVLSARRTGLTGGGAAPLGKLLGLQKLDLYKNNITNASASGWGGLKSLRILVLSHTKVGDAGVIQLQRLRSLRNLQLYHARVTNKVAPAFANLKRLHTLNLGKTLFSKKGVTFLAMNMPSLRALRVSAMMSAATMFTFRRKYPSLRITEAR